MRSTSGASLRLDAVIGGDLCEVLTFWVEHRYPLVFPSVFIPKINARGVHFERADQLVLKKSLILNVNRNVGNLNVLRVLRRVKQCWLTMSLNSKNTCSFHSIFL